MESYFQRNRGITRSCLSHKMQRATYPVVFIANESCKAGWKNTKKLSCYLKNFIQAAPPGKHVSSDRR